MHKRAGRLGELHMPVMPTPLQRLAFLAALAGMAGCASGPAKRCEFPLWVTVTPDADGECRTAGAKWKDMGGSITDRDTILGCAPKDRIITNGTESNMGHEMAHQVERNCR